MNKLCVTKQGVTFFNNNKEDADDQQKNLFSQIKRRSSLPQLISAANLTEKQQVKAKLSKMSLRINELRDKGLKRMKMQKEDGDVRQILEQQYTHRKQYLKSKVPDLIRKTRDSLGNINTRVQRGRAYLDQLQNNYDNKFVFRAPNKHQKD